jgi:hypothetical protein
MPVRAEETAKERTANVVCAIMIYPIRNAGCEPRIAPATDGSARYVVSGQATAGLWSLARSVGLAMLTTTTCFAAVQTGSPDNDPRRRRARADP